MRLLYSVLISALLFSFASSQSSREIHKTLPLKSNGRLVINTYKGSITITTHDKPKVELDIKIESDNSYSKETARDVEDTEIEIDSSENEVTLRTNYDKVKHHDESFWDWFSDHFGTSYSLPLVHYTIKMPRTAELRIKDYKSKTRIDGLQSELRFETYKGEAEINNLSGGIDLETYKGNINVSFAKLKTNSSFETYKGNITLEVPKDNAFELQTDFEKRVDFTTNFNVESIEHGKRHHYYDYRGKINGGGPVLELTSEKGDLRLNAK